MGLLIVLVIYTVLILFFVPLKTIARWQDKVQTTIRKWLAALKD